MPWDPPYQVARGAWVAAVSRGGDERATRERRARIQSSRIAPAMPNGITYMKTIRNTPKIAQGAALEMSWAQLGTNWMKSAPKTAPEIDASPPMTLPMSRVTDRHTSKESGAT